MLERYKSFKKKGSFEGLSTLPSVAIAFVVGASVLAVGSQVLYGITPLGTGVDTCNITLGGACANNVSYTVRQGNQAIGMMTAQLPLMATGLMSAL